MAQDPASQSPAPPLIESDQIEGTAVYDANGKRIGTIKRLVIEKVSGHVAHAVTTFSGFLGLGYELYTIPREQLPYEMLSTATRPASRRTSCGMRPSSPVKMTPSYQDTKEKSSTHTI